MPMALRDKLNSLAAEAASKANTAIENGKLSLKINNEEKKIDEFTLNIGELVLDKLDGGETFDDAIMALYSSIQALSLIHIFMGAPPQMATGIFSFRG